MSSLLQMKVGMLIISRVLVVLKVLHLISVSCVIKAYHLKIIIKIAESANKVSHDGYPPVEKWNPEHCG